MSVRVIFTTALTTGWPSVPFTSPSMAVIWANALSARSSTPAPATTKLRDFIKPPKQRRRFSMKLKYNPGRRPQEMEAGRLRTAPPRGIWLRPLRLFEEADLLFGGGLGFAFLQRAADHAEHFDGVQRGAGNEDALLVAERVGRGDRDAHRLEQHQIVGNHAFHALAVAELQADPEAGHFGAGLEDLPLRRGGVEFADESDALYIGIGDHHDVALRGNQLDTLGLEVNGGIDVAGQRFPVVAPDQHFLVGGSGHLPSKTTAMFQTFRALLYHWLDVRGARAVRVRFAPPDRCVPESLPDRKGPGGQSSRCLRQRSCSIYRV